MEEGLQRAAAGDVVPEERQEPLLATPTSETIGEDKRSEEQIVFSDCLLDWRREDAEDNPKTRLRTSKDCKDQMCASTDQCPMQIGFRPFRPFRLSSLSRVLDVLYISLPPKGRP